MRHTAICYLGHLSCYVNICHPQNGIAQWQLVRWQFIRSTLDTYEMCNWGPFLLLPEKCYKLGGGYLARVLKRLGTKRWSGDLVILASVSSIKQETTLTSCNILSEAGNWFLVFSLPVPSVLKASNSRSAQEHTWALIIRFVVLKIYIYMKMYD